MPAGFAAAAWPNLKDASDASEDIGVKVTPFFFGVLSYLA
jgi:hypothetical protein